MRNLIHYCSNISNTVPCIDIAELVRCEYKNHGRVLNRWVDYLPFHHRRAIYDTLNPDGNNSLGEYPRFVSLEIMANIMRYEFVVDFGRYLHNEVFCVFFYKNGNKYEINGWDVSNVLLGDITRYFYHSTSQDILIGSVWGYVEKEKFERWINENIKTSSFRLWG